MMSKEGVSVKAGRSDLARSGGSDIAEGTLERAWHGAGSTKELDEGQ